jgi:hypothetical protein
METFNLLLFGNKKNKRTPPSFIPVPIFISAEIGLVNKKTLVVTFSTQIYATDYTIGITIKDNELTQTINSATLQNGNKIVHYILNEDLAQEDVVTWEYSGGDYANIADATKLMLTIPAQTITNNIINISHAGWAMGILCLTYSN